MDYKAIYSQRLAGYLMMNGFVLKGIDKNEKYTERNVFFFKNTDAINKVIEEYLSNRKA